MINKVWGSFIIIGIVFSIFTNQLGELNIEILNSTKISLEMIIKIFPVMALWLGISKIAEKSGLLNKISQKISFILKYIFPEIPKDHESFSYIGSNIIANMFGLGNAATPFGLKAMQSLQKLNNSDTASRSMITFLVLNTSGMTLIPTTIISLRMMYGSANPTNILLPCIIITFSSTLIGLVIDRIFARRYRK